LSPIRGKKQIIIRKKKTTSKMEPEKKKKTQKARNPRVEKSIRTSLLIISSKGGLKNGVIMKNAEVTTGLGGRVPESLTQF